MGSSSVVDRAAVRQRRQLPDDEFRHELRSFLKANHPGRAPKDDPIGWQKAFHAVLVDGGWGGPSWPVEHGGMDLPFSKQIIHTEELSRAVVPGPLGTGVGIAGPTIIRHGTDDQKARWLRPMLRADEVWAQGFSEPGAGSDLPSLRTRAARDGDTYVVNGQKIWSSSAHLADRLFCLVRTGTPDDRQRGITYLVVDARAPGVTIRPIRDMTGGTAFCEVFLDDVRVPVTDRIGGENEGWAITRTSLGHERAAGAFQQATRYRRIVNELIELARSRGLADDPTVRQRLARFVIWQRINEYNGMRTIGDIVTHGDPGPQSSVARLSISLFEQELHVLAVDVLGMYGVLDRRSPEAVERGRWSWGLLRTRASTIGAGTAEIHRNTVGERVLGLPHEPDVFAR